jgi:hypothetical protein
VELALDHAHDNEVARAYDRGERFDDRIKLFTGGENSSPLRSMERRLSR